MIDINNEDMTQNPTFIHQIHTNDDTNMMTRGYIANREREAEREREDLR